MRFENVGEKLIDRYDDLYYLITCDITSVRPQDIHRRGTEMVIKPEYDSDKIIDIDWNDKIVYVDYNGTTPGSYACFSYKLAPLLDLFVDDKQAITEYLVRASYRLLGEKQRFTQSNALYQYVGNSDKIIQLLKSKKSIKGLPYLYAFLNHYHNEYGYHKPYMDAVIELLDRIESEDGSIESYFRVHCNNYNSHRMDVISNVLTKVARAFRQMQEDYLNSGEHIVHSGADIIPNYPIKFVVETPLVGV